MRTVPFPQLDGPPITEDLFGGNFLADRYDLGPDSEIAPLIDRLGVDGLRYPGGSLTERLFDIRNPDTPRATNDDGSSVDFVPLSDFLAYAHANGHAATIVLPTRDNLSMRADSNGDRYPAFDEGDLRSFVFDLATGKYGEAEIAALEIGNEYWGSGQMSAVEYGRLSSRMADIIDEELQNVATVTGQPPDIDVIVQAGTNHGYSNLSAEYQGQSNEDVLADLNTRFGTDFGDEVVFFRGNINWRAINDELILREFSADEADAVDGVVTHIYSRSQIQDGHRDFALKQINDNWGERFDDIDIHVTEWNTSSADNRLDSDTDFGLRQAHEILNTFEAMVSAGVDQAHVWPLLQNTRNALSPDRIDGEFSPAGELFSRMADALPGKTMLDFAVDDRDTTEFQGVSADLHGFYGHGEMVFYLASTSNKTETQSIALDDLIASGGTVRAAVIGVPPGASPGGINTAAQVEHVPQDDIYDDGLLVATLDPGEILEVRITDFQPTDTLRDAIAQGRDDEAPVPLPDDPDIDLDEFPTIPLPIEEQEEDNQPDQAPEDDDGGLIDGIGWLLALIPMLLLAGLGG